MNPINRTLAFVVAAVLSLATAGLTYWSNLPAKMDLTEEIGEPFFPDFTDPNTATSLQVASFDKEASKTNTFSVEFKDGKWRIPSHNNYPADGKDRLKTTAASVIGITRGAPAGKSKEAHKQHNLLDPLDEKSNEAEGRGDRITLKAGDKTLVDLIIGKKVEGSANKYYVRRQDEERFFITELKIDLSTKFADWIEPDLLDLKKDDIQTIVIDRYSVDEAKGEIVPGDQSDLKRETATSDWSLKETPEGMKPKTSVINAMLSSFDDLKIIGVRRKPEGLSASLQGTGAVKVNNTTLMDLQNRGYFYTPKGLVSNEGDILVSTFDGVSYVLRFGEVFTGSDVDIEIGSADEATKKPAEEPKKEGDPAKPDETAADPAKDSSVKKSRYVFITAQFDEAALGAPPVEPKKPEPPKEDAPAAPAEGDKPAEPAKPAEGEKPATPDPKAEAKAAYEAALKQYETDSDVYRIRKKEYDDKKTAGEKKAKALNARFADWYYVISEDLFDELRVKTEDLVEPVAATTPAGEAEAGFPKTPDLPKVPMTDAPAAEGEKPAAPAEGDKPAEPATPAEGEKPAEPAAPAEGAEKPAEGTPPPADTAKPAEAPAPPVEEAKPAAPAEPPAGETPPK